jgi:hypothetical protein
MAVVCMSAVRPGCTISRVLYHIGVMVLYHIGVIGCDLGVCVCRYEVLEEELHLYDKASRAGW